MDNKRLAATAMVLTLAGCAPLTGPRTQETADGDFRLLAHPAKCEVGVYVDEDKYILIDHEPVHVRGCSTSRTIVWKVDGPYKFAADGIKLKSPTPSPPGPRCAPSMSNKQYTCTFQGAASGTSGDQFLYTIVLTRNDGSTFGSLDPMMINY